MNYNILDQIIDEDNYGPNSAEWRLRGLSAAGQEAYARKLFHDVSNKASRKGYEGHFGNGPFNEGVDLMTRYNQMPEEAQDSFLLTLKENPIEFAEPGDFNQKISTARTGNGRYSLENGKVYLDSQNDRTFFHELGHSTSQRMNPRFDKSKTWTNIANLEGSPREVHWVHPKNYYVPDFAAQNNFGKEITELSDKWIRPNDGSKSMRYALNSNLREDMDKRMRFRPSGFIETVGSSALDWGGLQPRYEGEGLSHSKAYKEYWQDEARNKWMLDEEKSSFAPLSMEGFAEMFEIVSEPGGKDWLIKNMPGTYKRFIEILKDDHRLKKFRPPKYFRDIK